MKVHAREVIIKQVCFKLLCYNDHMALYRFPFMAEDSFNFFTILTKEGLKLSEVKSERKKKSQLFASFKRLLSDRPRSQTLMKV